MKICPKCGYLETEYWRQNRWRTNVEFSPLHEFEFNHPELARSLKTKQKGEALVDGYSAYRLSGVRQIVERILRTEYEAFGMSAFHQPMEHVEHRKPRSL